MVSLGNYVIVIFAGEAEFNLFVCEGYLQDMHDPGILVSTRKRTTLRNAPPLKSDKSEAKSKCVLSTQFVW